MALLVLLLVAGAIFLVYRYSAKSTGDDSHMGTPRSDVRREALVARIQDSDKGVSEVHAPEKSPVYHSLNQEYPGIERIHDGPPIYLVHEFLSDHEANFLIDVGQSCLSRSLTAGDVEDPRRTSTNCYFEQDDLPGLMQKVMSLTNKPLEHCEYPQVAKYEAGQHYDQHFDAFRSQLGPTHQKELTFGGNRLVTVLIYLNNVGEGGATHFPYMDLGIPPRKGTALVFFPSTADGEIDMQALHAALPAIDTKYVSQVWVRERSFTGNPRKTPKQLSTEEIAGWTS
jgi:prolyl 4-hydroxylase